MILAQPAATSASKQPSCTRVRPILFVRESQGVKRDLPILTAGGKIVGIGGEGECGDVDVVGSTQEAGVSGRRHVPKGERQQKNVRQVSWAD